MSKKKTASKEASAKPESHRRDGRRRTASGASHRPTPPSLYRKRKILPEALSDLPAADASPEPPPPSDPPPSPAPSREASPSSAGGRPFERLVAWLTGLFRRRA